MSFPSKDTFLHRWCYKLVVSMLVVILMVHFERFVENSASMSTVQKLEQKAPKNLQTGTAHSYCDFITVTRVNHIGIVDPLLTM